MIRYDWNILRKYPMHIVLAAFIAIAGDKRDFVHLERKILVPISRMKNNASYMLNPLALISHKGEALQSEIAQYIEIASLRSYYVYKNTGDLTLPTYYVKNLEAVHQNPLLSVHDETISFKHEEN